MDDGLVVRGSIVIPAAELVWKFSRSSGPGGQGVNTTDSKVQLAFDVEGTSALPPSLKVRALERLRPRLVDGVLTVSASEQRSQLQNRRAAEQRLVDTLRAAIAPPPRTRRPTKPSKAAVDRRIKEKKSRGQTKRLRSSTRDMD
jgi:ribosome-associated protein